MLKSYGGWVVGGLQDFSVSPSPLGPNWVFELGWIGSGLGLGVLGTGLDKKVCVWVHVALKIKAGF